MAKKLNQPIRRCDIMVNGPIAEMGFICGPIYNAKLTVDQIERMVLNRRQIFEIDPANTKNKVLLTSTNYKVSPFEKKEVPIVQEISPAATTVEAPTEVVKDSAPYYKEYGKNKHKKHNQHHGHKDYGTYSDDKKIDSNPGVKESNVGDNTVTENEQVTESIVPTEEVVSGADM